MPWQQSKRVRALPMDILSILAPLLLTTHDTLVLVARRRAHTGHQTCPRLLWRRMEADAIATACAKSTPRCCHGRPPWCSVASFCLQLGGGQRRPYRGHADAHRSFRKRPRVLRRISVRRTRNGQEVRRPCQTCYTAALLSLKILITGCKEGRAWVLGDDKTL